MTAARPAMVRAKLARLCALAWSDTRAALARLVLLAAGVAVGVAALAICFGVGAGVESVVTRRVLGVLPDRLVVEPATMALGPVKMTGAAIDEDAIHRIQSLPGVTAVARRLRLPLPAHLTATYQGKSFYTDVIVEAVEPVLVEPDVPPPRAFAEKPPGEDVPAVLPAVMMDVLNVGFSVNTGLPQLNEQMILDHHFALNLGSSSFKWGPTVTLRCVVVGISSRIGVGGPALPYAYLPTLEQAIRARGGSLPTSGASSLTVLLESPEALPAVSDAVRQMGLDLPQQVRAAQVTASLRGVSLALSLFGLLVLAVAGTGIANGLALMVKDESGEIGLFRAVGASYRDVLALYLLRAAYVGLLGAAVGSLVALLGCAAINAAAARALPGLLSGNERLAALTVGHLLQALLFGVGASLLAGLLPAREAARTDPAAALRER